MGLDEFDKFADEEAEYLEMASGAVIGKQIAKWKKLEPEHKFARKELQEGYVQSAGATRIAHKMAADKIGATERVLNNRFSSRLHFYARAHARLLGQKASVTQQQETYNEMNTGSTGSSSSGNESDQQYSKEGQYSDAAAAISEAL